MDKDFVRSPGALLKFKVQGKTIIHCYDVPHLLKVQRNNLQVKNMTHFIEKRWDFSDCNKPGKKQVASWKDVADLYTQDRKGFPRRLKKINYEHITPTKLKMKVCIATQVFSQTYGNVMQFAVEKKKLRSEAAGTAQILWFFNDLFDSLNGGGPVEPGSLKGSISKDSVHFVYWEYALSMLAKMNFVCIDTGKINTNSLVINRFMSTIRGYQEITRICLNMKIEEVSLRYFPVCFYFVNVVSSELVCYYLLIMYFVFVLVNSLHTN